MRDIQKANYLTQGTSIPKLYNLKEVSVILDIPMGTLYNMNYYKTLPCIKIGKRIRMTEEHILQVQNMEEKLYGC